ncbi:MAG TPA: PilZ domain-containing protein [Cellvibrio sp.]|nr:PilZ domain-containing protein [Cellvibrio sp.]
MTDERRRFSRIDFDARVEIAQGNKNWQAQLLDISLKGVLLAKIGSYQLHSKIPVLVKVILSDLTSIAMSTRVVQDSPEQSRLACDSIDIDSISHLRRLVELNIGDAKAVERELSQLISGDD